MGSAGVEVCEVCAVEFVEVVVAFEEGGVGRCYEGAEDGWEGSVGGIDWFMVVTAAFGHGCSDYWVEGTIL